MSALYGARARGAKIQSNDVQLPAAEPKNEVFHGPGRVTSFPESWKQCIPLNVKVHAMKKYTLEVLWTPPVPLSILVSRGRVG